MKDEKYNVGLKGEGREGEGTWEVVGGRVREG